jgi:hypothetical protein
MDLFDSLNGEREDRALDRLEVMLDAYDAETSIEQEVALERAMVYCEREWGSYDLGLEALVKRIEAKGGETPAAVLAVLRLRDEAAEPGTIIRALRTERARAAGRGAEYAAIVARYGGEDKAKAPNPFERLFINACRALAPEGEGDDPLAPLAGWQLAWHDLPAALSQAVAAAHPLPATITAAKAEVEGWDQRLREVEILFDCPGSGVLPTACAARRKLVEGLWRAELAPTTAEDFAARLDYWAERGGDDAAGYHLLRRDWLAVAGQLAAKPQASSTKDRARQLRAANPDWSLARIGKELGISRQAVHKHLKGFTPPV